MSHFSVIVATKNEPTEAVLKRELQPFHEFECTGVADEFVQDVDQTEEARTQFAKHTVTRLKLADGSLVSFFDDKGNWRHEYSQPDPNRAGWENDRRTYFVPYGCEKVEVPAAEVESFAEYVEGWYGKSIVPFGMNPDLDDVHKYGYALANEAGDIVKVIDRTNPGKKWDWWRVGGRYAGKFQKKGRRPSVRRDLSYEWNNAAVAELPTGVDSCRKSDLDIAAMKTKAVADRRGWWEKCLEETGLSDVELFDAIASKRVYHAKWMALSEPKPRGEEFYVWAEADGGYKARELGKLWDSPEIPEGVSLQDWINDAPALTTFAFLMDGKWAEKGEMGWWACVSNENENWHRDFLRLFETVPNDYWLTVVDCHI